MEYLLLTAAAVLVYLCRLSGFVLHIKQSSPALERFLSFVPLAVFSALVVPSLAREPELLGLKLLALATAGVVMRLSKQLGLGILVGLGLFLLLVYS